MPVEGRGLSSRQTQYVGKGLGDWATYKLHNGFGNRRWRRASNKGVRSCPRAGCGKSACPVVCPVKASMFSRREPAGATVRRPVVWIAGWRATKTLKPIDKISLGEITSHRAVTKVNANVASKMSGPEGRACIRRAKAAWVAEI